MLRHDDVAHDRAEYHVKLCHNSLFLMYSICLVWVKGDAGRSPRTSIPINLMKKVFQSAGVVTPVAWCPQFPS